MCLNLSAVCCSSNFASNFIGLKSLRDFQSGRYCSIKAMSCGTRHSIAFIREEPSQQRSGLFGLLLRKKVSSGNRVPAHVTGPVLPDR
jgi:hypothetical protein